MKVDILKEQEIILDETQNKTLEIDYEQNIKPDKSLLDYYLADERAETAVSSFLYTRSGTSQDLLNVKPLNYCKMAENNYPFENDSEETRTAYKHLAEFYAYQALEESRFRSAFTDSGIDTATITIDAKGEIKIETKDYENQEQLESVKKKLTEFGKTATAFRNIIFREGQQYAGYSGERKNEFSGMYYTGWILYQHYGLRVEDLSVSEDGRISGLIILIQIMSL